MRPSSHLKGGGYLISTVSVALLGVVSWQTASKNAALLACLILGMALSVVGMMLRWHAHRLEQRAKNGGQR